MSSDRGDVFSSSRFIYMYKFIYIDKPAFTKSSEIIVFIIVFPFPVDSHNVIMTHFYSHSPTIQSIWIHIYNTHRGTWESDVWASWSYIIDFVFLSKCTYTVK